jgi:hypothetical protein
MAQQLVVGGHGRQGPGVGRQGGQAPLGERGNRGRLEDLRGRRRGGGPVGVGGLAGFHRDHVGGHRPGAQRGGDPGDDVIVGHPPVQEQDPGQGAGSGCVTVGGAVAAHQASWTGMNRPAALACSRTVAPGRAPGLRSVARR